ncbi:MAG: formate--tetrahydrofolate ligase [candidate division WOR-3 bacterium]
MEHIRDIAKKAGIAEEFLEYYGNYKAKVRLSLLDEFKDKPDGKLVLVTAITPTPAGEGKTTTAIGLTQALWRMGIKNMIALREPSLGPVFGIKGGATGGGKSCVLPEADINLHFNGDFHAITTAHNLLAALMDNSLYWGNKLKINPRRIFWPRALDMNDRSLRNIVIGLGGEGFPRESTFYITAASEIMAIMGLSTDINNLKERLGNIVVAMNTDGGPVFARDLGAHEAMAAVLRDALMPNLVQTTEGTPAFIHTGPFANIAHGNSSIIGTRMALKLGDIVITEGGFGADLGAEKFMDIKAYYGGLKPDAVVLVASIRALKYHGGKPLKELTQEDTAALEKGIPNLIQHVENMKKFGVGVVVAVNAFPTDSKKEIDLLLEAGKQTGVPVVLSEIFTKGGEGGIDMAEAVLEVTKGKNNFRFLYDHKLPTEKKMEIIAKEIYRADGIELIDKAKTNIKRIKEWGMDDWPVCMAKTQYSFSHDPSLLGAPRGFTIPVRDIYPAAGARFVVAVLGDMMLMPGLPKEPAALEIKLDENNEIVGIR